MSSYFNIFWIWLLIIISWSSNSCSNYSICLSFSSAQSKKLYKFSNDILFLNRAIIFLSCWSSLTPYFRSFFFARLYPILFKNIAVNNVPKSILKTENVALLNPPTSDNTSVMPLTLRLTKVYEDTSVLILSLWSNYHAWLVSGERPRSSV